MIVLFINNYSGAISKTAKLKAFYVYCLFTSLNETMEVTVDNRGNIIEKCSIMHSSSHQTL